MIVDRNSSDVITFSNGGKVSTTHECILTNKINNIVDAEYDSGKM